MSLLAQHRAQKATEIIDASFTYYRANASVLIGIAFILMLPTAVIGAFLPKDAARILDLLGNLLIPLGQGAIAIMVASSLERGESIGIGEAFRYGQS